MPRRYARPGFSIIELLVVMGIIAVLVSLIYPTIGRAKESSNRVNCASNLRQIGAAALAFAANHDGAFPMSYATPVPAADRRRMPLLITRDDTITKGEGWRDYGTPWSEWSRYVATESVWQCPSSRYELKFVNGPNEPQVTPETWGSIVWTDYAYIGGIYYTNGSKKNTGLSYPNWGIFSPAVSTKQNRLAERLLATDAAFYAGQSQWSRQYHINHPQQNRKNYVDAQFAVYADGHVSDLGRPAYNRNGRENPLNGSNYSLYVDSKGKIGGFYYWGPSVAYTPDQPIPPPVPPPPPPGPVTTPPPPPPPPTVPPPPPPPPTNVPDPL